MSRRFVARTRQQVEAWQARPLDDLAVAVLLLDDVHVGAHCLIVTLAVTEDGTKHALGLWEEPARPARHGAAARVLGPQRLLVVLGFTACQSHGGGACR